MDQAEASGKTVDDALRAALAKLGATRDQVEFTVLDEGAKGGLFKRARDAVVRVERLSQPQAADERRETPDTRIPHSAPGGPRGRDRGDRGGDRGGNRQRNGTGGMDRGGGRGPRPGRPSRAPLEQAVPKLTEQDFLRAPGVAPSTDEVRTEPAAPRSGAPRGQRSERAGQGMRAERGPRPDRPARPERLERGDRPPRERRGREDGPVIEPDINAEEVDFAAQIVDDLLRMLEIDCELTIREPLTPGDGKGAALAVIDISGEDLGVLIGRRGDTLLSLQYLVNLIVTRRFPDRGGVTIDVEHYRHRREEQIMSLAQRMADRVRESGSPITLEPMSASERRLIHLALADDPDLETNSIGEGENRKVVISSRH